MMICDKPWGYHYEEADDAIAEFLAIIEERAGSDWKVAMLVWKNGYFQYEHKPLAKLLEEKP